MQSTAVIIAVIVGCAFAVVPPQLANVIECDICTFLEPELFALIGKEEPVVEKDLDNICERIPVFGSECVKLVNSKIDALVKAINKEGTNPKQVCIDIDACKANLEAVVPAAPVAAVLKPTIFANVIECDICTFLEPELFALIGKEEPVVEKDLDKLCERIPVFGGECEKLVNSKIDALVKAINKEGTNPKQVCIDIDACKRNFVEKARANADIQLNEGEKCFLCHALGPELEKLAGKEEPVIVKDLEKICHVIKFTGLEGKCDTYIEKEGAMIAKVLSEDEGSSAKELCEKIGWCSTAALVEVAKPVELFNGKCILCHYLGPQLEKLAAREEPVVAKDLEFVCKVVSFDKKLEGECDGYIEKEGAHIATILTNDSGSSGAELCKKIGWC